MKKGLMIFLFFLVLSMAGCEYYQIEYQLQVDGSQEFILEQLEENYSVGAKITIKTQVLDDTDLHLFVNDEFVCNQTIIEENGKASHWELSFIMPDKNTKISLKTSEDLKKDLTQKIIYYDNEVAYIWYEILFNYEKDDNTLIKHQEFIEKSGLNKIDLSDTFYFNQSPYIFLALKPAQETLEVMEFIYQLKRKYPSIININRELEYYTTEVYCHNPLYYGLKEEQKILFEYSLNFLSKGIYTNVEEVQKALDEYLTSEEKWYLDVDGITNNINNIYNEEYFEKNILIVTDTIVTGSGSNRQNIENIYLKDNIIYIFVKMYFASIGTCDMQYTTFAVTIDRSYFDDVKNLEQLLLYKNK